MKNKKGFTLVELLAVIVILAVILVIAVPRITDVIKKTRLSSLESTAKLIVNQAEKKYTENQVLDNSSIIKCSDVANLNDTDYGACKITIDEAGNASVILNGKKNGKFDNLTCSGTKDNMVCNEGQTSTTKKCYTGKTSLAQGDEYIDGQYTYRYKQEIGNPVYNSWENINDDGWAVILSDKTSTEAVTSELCGSIDNKPIVNMVYMFYKSQATSLDLSSFDTSNVTIMYGMFAGSQATSLDLSSFDTSKVTNMSYMFDGSQATSLDISSFDTSNVTNMDGMFQESQVTEIKGLNKFNTSNVTNMSYMFDGSAVTSLDLSSFDTSNVTNMSSMFSFVSGVESLDLSNFDMSNVTSMSCMFESATIGNLDLSKLNVINLSGMENLFGFSGPFVDILDISGLDINGVSDDDFFNIFFGINHPDNPQIKIYVKNCEYATRLNTSSSNYLYSNFNIKSFFVKDTTC